MKTYKITQRYCSEDIWIIEAEDDTAAMAMANDTEPDDTKIIPYTTKMRLLDVEKIDEN